MKTCPKCKVPLKLGMAIINQVGKVDAAGNFIPANKCKDGDTVYPAAPAMISVDKCPECGYSIAEL